jgi:hypothetical protein
VAPSRRAAGDAKNWDSVSWDDGYSPSEIASAVKDWIARLKSDPDAVLHRDRRDV